MTGEQVAWMIASGLAGVIICMVGFWAKAMLEGQRGIETKVEERRETDQQRELGQVHEFAKLQAHVELLMAERRKCDELAERVARGEAFQSWAEPLLEKCVDGLAKIAAFEAKFEQQLITLFKAQAAIIAKVERMVDSATSLATGQTLHS